MLLLALDEGLRDLCPADVLRMSDGVVLPPTVVGVPLPLRGVTLPFEGVVLCEEVVTRPLVCDVRLRVGPGPGLFVRGVVVGVLDLGGPGLLARTDDDTEVTGVDTRPFFAGSVELLEVTGLLGVECRLVLEPERVRGAIRE